jgi:hypothetical protein
MRTNEFGPHLRAHLFHASTTSKQTSIWVLGLIINIDVLLMGETHGTSYCIIFMYVPKVALRSVKKWISHHNDVHISQTHG